MKTANHNPFTLIEIISTRPYSYPMEPCLMAIGSSTNAGATQPGPSGIVYKKAYQTLSDIWMDCLAKECCKIAHHATWQPLEWSCCFARCHMCARWLARVLATANSIFQEPASILQVTSHAVIQRLGCCPNVVLSRRVNHDIINNRHNDKIPILDGYMDNHDSLPIQ
jgi:hypothetical protein